MSAGRASSRCDYHLLLEQGVCPGAVGQKGARNRCPDGVPLPGEQGSPRGRWFKSGRRNQNDFSSTTFANPATILICIAASCATNIFAAGVKSGRIDCSWFRIPTRYVKFAGSHRRITIPYRSDDGLRCGLRKREGMRGDNTRTLLDGNELIGTDFGERFLCSAGPLDFDGIHLRGGPQTEDQHQFAGGKIARPTAQHLGLRVAACGYTHCRANSVAT